MSVFIWTQPEVSQLAGNSKCSVDCQGSSGLTAPSGLSTSGPLCLAESSLGAARATRDSGGPQAPCLYFLSLAFLCSLLGQRLRVKGNTEEYFPECPNSPHLLPPTLQRRLPSLSTDTLCPRTRIAAGCPWAASRENRWPCEGTKDCESALDVEGTSQTRTFKGLPSLHSATSVSGKETLFGSSTGD